MASIKHSSVINVLQALDMKRIWINTKHAGENAYECKTCGKGFANSTELWNHDSTHSEEYT